jgi:cation:H+ antiporter
MAAQSLQISTVKGLSPIMLLMQSEQMRAHSRQHAGHRFAEPLVTMAAKHSSQARMQIWQALIHGWLFMAGSFSHAASHHEGSVCNASLLQTEARLGIAGVARTKPKEGVTNALLLIAASCLVLFVGAELLVRGGASMALRLGLSPLLVGLTVVAYGTSTPELLVALKASIAGNPDLAIGNVVGSNLFNLGVILGLCAVVSPLRTHLQVLKWDAPVLVAATILTPLTFRDGIVGRAEGGLLLVLAAAYTWWAVRIARRDQAAAHEANVDVPEIRKRGGPLLDILQIAGGIAVLIFGSKVLVDNSVVVAKSLGVSDVVIGLTIIAAGTSMPELATSLVAAIRGQSDIALGNVLGSSLFNLFFVLGGAAVIHPVRTVGLQPFDLWGLIGMTVLMFPLLWRDRRVSRIEGSILLGAYATYLAIMWPK